MLNPTQGDQDPNKVFDGLSFVEWLKVIFRTRAGLIRQHEKIIDAMFESMNESSARLTGSMHRVSVLMVRQHKALEAISTYTTFLDSQLPPERAEGFRDAHAQIIAVLAEANADV